MSGFDASLIHRCTIERQVAGIDDAYGMPTADWQPVATLQLCRLIEGSESVTVSEKIAPTVVSKFKLLLPKNADIQERDRITTLTGGATPLHAGKTFTVESLIHEEAVGLNFFVAHLELVA